MIIEDATDAAIPVITAIYNDAVLHTTAIWNESVVDEEDRHQWLAARRAEGQPVLVALDEDRDVLGYATYGDWRAWEGYRYTAEHSVYVRGDQRGRGVGKALMVALIDRAREAGKHVLVAGIDAANEPSLRMHEKLGFERVGLLPQVGRKFDRWLDLAFVQLTFEH